MSKRTAARFWNGTTEQALALLRCEYSFILADRASRLTVGQPLRRRPGHARALRSIPGEYAYQLGVLCAAAPESSRGRIKDAFSALLSTDDAATMRGVADGTEYVLDVRVSGAEGIVSRDMVHLDSSDGHGRRVLAFCRRTFADLRGAEELRSQIEREALAAGAEDVRVSVRAA